MDRWVRYKWTGWCTVNLITWMIFMRRDVSVADVKIWELDLGLSISVLIKKCGNIVFFSSFLKREWSPKAKTAILKPLVPSTQPTRLPPHWINYPCVTTLCAFVLLRPNGLTGVAMLGSLCFSKFSVELVLYKQHSNSPNLQTISYHHFKKKFTSSLFVLTVYMLVSEFQMTED